MSTAVLDDSDALIAAWDPKVGSTDPFPIYKALRERKPLHYVESANIWVVSRYEDVAAIARDDETFHQRFEYREIMRNGPGVVEQPYFQLFRRMLFLLDGPDHRRVRMHFAKWFLGPNAVRQITPHVEASAEWLMKHLADREDFDFVADYAHHLPLRVIGGLLGVPESDQHELAHLISTMHPLIESTPKTQETRDKGNVAVEGLRDYFGRFIAERRKNPIEGDLVTTMIQAADSGGFADEDELLANVLLLYQAGHETTAASLTLAWLTLQRHPEQMARLMAEPELLNDAVEELLRYDSASQGFSRSSQQDVVVRGQEIKAGTFIMVLLASANRDEAMFPDPDRFIIDRRPQRTMTFGGGAHLCIAHLLARQEMRIGLAALLKHRPNLRPETLTPPRAWYQPTVTVRALNKLPVRG